MEQAEIRRLERIAEERAPFGKSREIVGFGGFEIKSQSSVKNGTRSRSAASPKAERSNAAVVSAVTASSRAAIH